MQKAVMEEWHIPLWQDKIIAYIPADLFVVVDLLSN